MIEWWPISIIGSTKFSKEQVLFLRQINVKKGSISWFFNIGRDPEDEVSFNDFIEFILENGPGESEHIDTYYHHCDMCRIRYDLVGKFESFAEDTRYILMKSGAYEKIDIYDQQLSWFDNRPYSTTNIETALPFFRELTKETILKLYLRYEMDFDMFGYSAQKFYEEGRDWINFSIKNKWYQVLLNIRYSFSIQVCTICF